MKNIVTTNLKLVTDKNSHIGYLKYIGPSVEEGIMDIDKSAKALNGFAEILKYFIFVEEPLLRSVNVEIPVKINKGSWEIDVVRHLTNAVLSPEGLFYTSATAYALSIAKKAASDGIFETGVVKDLNKIIKAGISTAQWVIKISSHIGTMSKNKLKDLKFRKNNEEIGVPNESGEYLFVPKKYLELFALCPTRLFSKSVSIVEENRSLEIGVVEKDKIEKVKISHSEKKIYYSESDQEGEILFPELKHGQAVELEGKITRGNENTNTIGFQYKDHILTCKPGEGSIVAYKNKIISDNNELFSRKVKIIGKIDRLTIEGEEKENRPRIIFSDIIRLEKDKEPSLFE